MKQQLRKILRLILQILTRLVLHKHQPTVIAVIGDGPTSITREILYAVISSKYPSRRNLEVTEAEFSVPLTIFDYPNYPNSYLEWLWVILKTSLQLISLPGYKHFLVLELNSTHKDLRDSWLKVISPDTLIEVGTSTNLKLDDDTEVISISGDIELTENLLSENFAVADMLAAKYEIYSNLEGIYSQISFPSARIRFLSGKNGSTIIDATHYYFPIKFESVLEVAGENTGKRYLISDLELDQKQLPANWILNPKEFELSKEDILILRGKRTEILNKFSDLIATHKPLI